MTLAEAGANLVNAIKEKSKEPVNRRTIRAFEGYGWIELRSGKEADSNVPADYKFTKEGEEALAEQLGKKKAESQDSGQNQPAGAVA